MNDATPKPLTAPQLFAAYEPTGNCVCFYCGGRCDDTHAASDIVRPTFTALDTVTRSPWVCQGCVVAMAEGIDITTIDGEVKRNQKTRGYSWIATKRTRTACTKAHRQQLLEACMQPPSPPYAICISDSGQRHLLYRTPVCWSQDIVTVTLEGEVVTYEPTRLWARIDLCKRIAAATGKPALKEQLSAQSQMRIVEHYGDDASLAAWLAMQNEPLSRLAAWLCPPKEECISEYPGIATEPAAKPVAERDAKSRHRAVATTASLFD